MAGLTIDDSSFQKGIARYLNNTVRNVDKSVSDVAEELLRLSQREVPHDTGMLQNSGHVSKVAYAKFDVGYNRVYAAKMHEHPEYNFQKGRKGKYLEDPLKENLRKFVGYIENGMKRAMA